MRPVGAETCPSQRRMRVANTPTGVSAYGSGTCHATGSAAVYQKKEVRKSIVMIAPQYMLRECVARRTMGASAAHSS